MDASYLVSILGGLYGRLEPERALRVMKRELRRDFGACSNPT